MAHFHVNGNIYYYEFNEILTSLSTKQTKVHFHTNDVSTVDICITTDNVAWPVIIHFPYEKKDTPAHSTYHLFRTSAPHKLF